jgi:serine/threonine protein kinase
MCGALPEDRLTPEGLRSHNQSVAKAAAEVGTTANQYQILAKLASGGMAEIFLARGASVAGVERYCVLKRILRERARDADFVQMFVHEARLVAQLQHPNIASVYDIGMLGDSYFFTMEYVHGETIRSLLQRAQELHRPLPLACVLMIIAGAAAGLHHAHERNASDGRPLGIVHRDVSPSNLMVSYEGNVKVVDFGVAKAEDRTVETRSGTVKGKISYLSPEQCRGTRVDRRSDVFSLGIVLWELLTGDRLYRRDSDFDNMTAIVHEAAPPPSARRSDLPSAIDDLVLRLLAKSPADRFQTAAEVVDAIEAASLQSGTILSTSAVGRLVRELFGVRAEPWLKLDGDAAALEPSTIESRPIPPGLGRLPSDAVGARIAGALDPILSRLVAERRAIAMPSAVVVTPQIERVTEVAAPGELAAPAPSGVAEDVASAVERGVPTSPPPGTGTSTTVFVPRSGLLAHVAPPEQPIAASAASPVVAPSPASTSGPSEPPLELGQVRAAIASSSGGARPGLRGTRGRPGGRRSRAGRDRCAGGAARDTALRAGRRAAAAAARRRRTTAPACSDRRRRRSPGAAGRSADRSGAVGAGTARERRSAIARVRHPPVQQWRLCDGRAYL